MSIKQFSVTISQRPLGVRFAHLCDESSKSKKQMVGVMQILMHSHGFALGLQTGDTLLAINGEPVIQLGSSKALQLFRSQSLPFQATFYRKTKICHPNPSEFPDLPTSPELKSDDPSSSPTSTMSEVDLAYSRTTSHDSFHPHDADDDQDHIDISTKYLVSGYVRTLKVGTMDKPNDDVLASVNAICAKYLCSNTIEFDKECKHFMLSTNGLQYGYHEWSVKIMKCDGFQRQEVGVVTNVDKVEDIEFENGIKNASEFGARAVYGIKRIETNKPNKKPIYYNYYTSIMDTNHVKCYRNLSQTEKINQVEWNVGDIIKIAVNFKKNNIKFFHNGDRVRKTISLQKGKIWFPFIAYFGDCQYEVVEHHHC